jgi:hypothetical protein
MNINNTSTFAEETFTQKTMVKYVEEQFCWESVYIYNNENVGPAGVLGHLFDREVVLNNWTKEEVAA